MHKGTSTVQDSSRLIRAWVSVESDLEMATMNTSGTYSHQAKCFADATLSFTCNNDA